MIQHQYWVTKKSVQRKLGTKEDDHIVSSDAELDAKLELFRSVSESCVHLQRIIDLYQERLCILAQEENAFGRYLKECGKNERNSDVGKSMSTAGKAISYCGHQRLTMRPPLVRLHHEVETFRGRAITDSRLTVSAMEKSRTAYRAALEWMKSASVQLDPDGGHGLDGFRKAQTQVRVSKASFDRFKLACLQKVDLLTAARCNMFSHALVLYENSLCGFSERVKQSLETAESKIKNKEVTIKDISQDETIFFNAEYTDTPKENKTKENKTKEKVEEKIEKPLLMTENSDQNESLEDLLLENSKSESEVPLLFDLEDVQPFQKQFMPSQLLLQQNNNAKKDKDGKNDKSAWFDLFAELDPLSNPDMVTGLKNSHSSV